MKATLRLKMSFASVSWPRQAAGHKVTAEIKQIKANYSKQTKKVTI